MNPENENQIIIPTQNELIRQYKFPEMNDDINYVTPKNFAISTQFFYIVRHEQRSTQYTFLNYQFEKYSGEKIDFIDFIDSVIRYHNPACKDFTGMPEQRILDWVKIKKQELETSTVPDQVTTKPDKKNKSIKINDLNKPILNQAQISILFGVMKDLNIISNSYLPKTTYSEIIQTLTGYSANTLRINFSASQFIDISDRPQDYQEIIDNLILVIRKLEKAKNEINTPKQKKL